MSIHTETFKKIYKDIYHVNMIVEDLGDKVKISHYVRDNYAAISSDFDHLGVPYDLTQDGLIVSEKNLYNYTLYLKLIK